jgi:arginine/ornithine N-succinyltransferase beta subunit
MEKESYSYVYETIKYFLQQRNDEKSKEVITKMEGMTNEEFSVIYWNMLSDKFLECF